MAHFKHILLSFVFSAALLPNVGRAEEASLRIITNRTPIDNQFVFGRNAASPPTLSKRVIDATHRGVIGLTPSDSRIKVAHQHCWRHCHG